MQFRGTCSIRVPTIRILSFIVKLEGVAKYCSGSNLSSAQFKRSFQITLFFFVFYVFRNKEFTGKQRG